MKKLIQTHLTNWEKRYSKCEGSACTHIAGGITALENLRDEMK